jgi:predicted GH43/DUF377 family glycosyl hydrolase
MTDFPVDQLVFTPADVDVSKSPLAGSLDAETHIVGTFNPGLTRLSNGNLLLVVRIAEALRKPTFDGQVHAIRWDPDRRYAFEGWPLEFADTSDPRAFELHGFGWKAKVPTSLSWLLPVELSPNGLGIVAIHYEKAIAPQGSYQSYGIEDPRISRVGDRWLMTTTSISPERQSTTLYSSGNALDWAFEGMVLDHQNRDMLIFQGHVGGQYWAQTRPLGEAYFAYPPGSPFHAGPSINLATSPDALHWRPHLEPHIRGHAGTPSTARIGGGAPPILTEVAGKRGWLTLWHGVEPHMAVGIYKTYWSLLDANEPWKVIATCHPPLIEANKALTGPHREQIYAEDVVFTSGIVEDEDGFIVASGEADFACRITHVPRGELVPSVDPGEQ